MWKNSYYIKQTKFEFFNFYFLLNFCYFFNPVHSSERVSLTPSIWVNLVDMVIHSSIQEPPTITINEETCLQNILVIQYRYDIMITRKEEIFPQYYVHNDMFSMIKSVICSRNTYSKFLDVIIEISLAFDSALISRILRFSTELTFLDAWQLLYGGGLCMREELREKMDEK